MTEKGLYYPDGTFKSDEDIKRDMALRGEMPALRFVTPVRLPKDIDTYLAEARQRQQYTRESAPHTEGIVEVALPRTSIVSFWGDLHMFAPQTDHERIQQELDVLRNSPDSYVVLGGDIVHGIFWGGEGMGEQGEDLTQQYRVMRALFESLEGRVLAGVSGQHDSKWAAKTGADPYSEFSELTGAPYIKGVGEMVIHVGDQTYKMVVQHKPRGHSIYNKNHPTMREARFDLQDADIYVNFDTHRKQIAQESIRKFGRSDVVTHISAGAYSSGDSYGSREGFVHMDAKEMYGCCVRLHADSKLVEVNYDIIEGHRQWV